MWQRCRRHRPGQGLAYAQPLDALDTHRVILLITRAAFVLVSW